MLRLRIRQEFDEACVAIRRVQGTVARFGHGESATKALVRGLGLDQPGIVISELLHARGAIDQQRRFLVLEVANESLNPVAVAGGYYADNLAKQVGDTEEANRALRGLIDDLRDLQLMEKNVLARRGNEKLTSSLKAALSLAFSGEGVSDGDDVSIHSTLAIDSAGRVFQLASTIDIDAIERQDLQLRLAGALRALMARQEQEPQVRGTGQRKYALDRLTGTINQPSPVARRMCTLRPPLGGASWSSELRSGRRPRCRSRLPRCFDVSRST